MKNITSALKLCFAFALCLIGMSAYAQKTVKLNGVDVPVVAEQTVTVDLTEKLAYEALQAAYDTVSVKEALGIEAIKDAKGYVVNQTTGEAVENTTDGWCDANGDAAGWNTKDTMVCVKIYDIDEGGNEILSDSITYVASINNVLTAGYVHTAQWAIVANDKAALLTVKVNFVSNGIPDAPAAELDIKKINVVGRLENTIERYAHNGYETTADTIYAPDLATQLGLDKAALEAFFASDVYVAYNHKEMGYKVDSLQLLTETDGWMQRTAENNEGIAGDLTNEVCGQYYGGACSYFIQQMTYKNDSISYMMGQYPGNLVVGDELFADLYIMNGDKAVVLRHTTKIIEAQTEGFDAMTSAGNKDITIEMYPMTDYSSKPITVDLEEVATALGADAASISLKALASEGQFSVATTANNGGWWFDAQGFVRSHGDGCAFYIEPATSGDYSTLNMGQYPNALKAGESYNVKLYLVSGDKYYTLNITLNLVAKQQVTFDEMENVGTRTVNVQALQAGYVWSDHVGKISRNDLLAAIGSADPVLYGDEMDAETETISKTDNYTMGEKPGFWLDANGYVVGWGGGEAGSRWGMTLLNSTEEDIVFQFIQMDANVNVGDTYTGQVYLVNPEEGKYMTVNMVYRIVDTLVESEEVGETSIVLPVGAGGEELEKPFDMAVVAEALGVTEDEMAEAYCLHAESGNIVAATLTGGLGFTLEGVCAPEGEGVIQIYFESGNVYTVGLDGLPETFDINTEFVFELNAKIYRVHVRFVDTVTYTGVNSIKTSADSGKAYDLTGRQIGKHFKGIAIQNGKKVVK